MHIEVPRKKPWADNPVNQWLLIDIFGPHHVSMADDEQMSEIEQAFEVVRGGQLL